MERQQFTFYKSFYEAIRQLSKKDQLAAYTALCEYALFGTEPKLSGNAGAVLLAFKPNLDASRKKAEARANKDTDKKA